MRQALSIGLLSLYFGIGLQPYLPYLEYAVNYEYIKEVLCINKDKPQLKCNGKCHLAKELKEANDPDQKKKEHPPTFTELEITVHVNTNNSGAFLPSVFVTQAVNQIRELDFFREDIWIKVVTPPPQFS